MSESYVECLIKAKGPLKFKLLKYFLYFLTVLGVVSIMFLGFIGLLIAMVAGGLAYYVGSLCNIEYEYLYLDKELTVDRVYAQTRRKRVATYGLDKMEIVAPIHSYHLDNYKNRQVKTIDYSVGEELKPDRRYAIYLEGNERILFNPSEEMVKVMRNNAPRKIFAD